jgi:co-chaperonin GroES (HSP10)
MLDVESIEVLGPRLLVQMDEEPEHFSGGVIIKPESVHEVAETMGTVRRVGSGYNIEVAPGRYPLGVSEGDRVCFIKFYRNTKENECIQSMLGDGLVIIRIQDVLFVRKENEEGED